MGVYLRGITIRVLTTGQEVTTAYVYFRLHNWSDRIHGTKQKFVYREALLRLVMGKYIPLFRHPPKICTDDRMAIH
jgi:hypothetical protein